MGECPECGSPLVVDEQGGNVCSNCGQRFTLMPDKPPASIHLQLWSIQQHLRAIPAIERHLKTLNDRTSKLEVGAEETRIRADERSKVTGHALRLLAGAIPLTGAVVAAIQRLT